MPWIRGNDGVERYRCFTLDEEEDDAGDAVEVSCENPEFRLERAGGMVRLVCTECGVQVPLPVVLSASPAPVAAPPKEE